MDTKEIKVGAIDSIRLDIYLTSILKDVSRAYIQKLIKSGLVLIDGKPIKAKHIVRKGEYIQIKLPQREQKMIMPENLPLDILYEDQSIAIVNKPKGMVVHPALGNCSGTLVNALLYHIDKLSTATDIIRPGIVHRLDKNTSGILVIAKNNFAHKSLVQQLKDRSMKRVYMALVHGVMNLDMGTINAPIGRNPQNRKSMAVRKETGREAITHYKVLERFDKYTLVEASLETGRTHQIRVHMAYINHPIVGDAVYTRKKNEFLIKSQLLHSAVLGFIHPETREYMEFKKELPDDFREVLQMLKKDR